jgi:hypothetical protein
MRKYIIILGISVIIMSLVIFYVDQRSEISIKLTAWATIILASATVLLSVTTVQQGQKSKNELLLREILSWITDIKNSSLIRLPGDVLIAATEKLLY